MTILNINFYLLYEYKFFKYEKRLKNIIKLLIININNLPKKVDKIK